MRKNFFLIVSVLSAAVICFAVFISSSAILDLIQNRIVERNMNRDLKFEDGMHVILIGAGSPMPDINRAGPCIAVIAGDKLFIVDAGEGASKNIFLSGLKPGKIDALFLTHFHSDHIAGAGEIIFQRWAGTLKNTQLPVYGPAGVEKVTAGFNAAYETDREYRIAHHGKEMMPPGGFGSIAKPFKLDHALTSSAVIYSENGVIVTAFNVDHFPVVPAVGYKFEYKGKSVVITGDTKYSETLVNHLKNADILFSEMMNTNLVGLMNRHASALKLKAITHDILSYHISPEQAARIADKANVKNLVFYHIIPPMPVPFFKFLYIGDAGKFFKNPVTMGEDGMHFFLPPGTDRIEKENLLKKKGEL